MAKKIVVNPEQLENAAQVIENQSTEYESVYKQFFDEIEGLSSIWQGEDNLAYVEQVRGFLEDFKNMKLLMDDYSKFLRISAKGYRQTQQNIKTAAGSLKN